VIEINDVARSDAFSGTRGMIGGSTERANVLIGVMVFAEATWTIELEGDADWVGV
jgi:hypothetical protein